jgi:CheY-like chemotaxis protein
VISAVLASVKILAVEDHADTREVLKIFLEWSGAEVVAVESGSAALEALQNQKPDVLICDLSMPQMDGFELLQKIRDLGPQSGSVPAIACTAFGGKEDVARTQRAGFQAHITKPVDPKILVATIADIVHSMPEDRRSADLHHRT